VLKEILSANRKKTSEDMIFMPYRNGILHGRDLGYANRVVAAKSWAALFAVNDWARAIKEGKKLPPPEHPAPTLKEQFSSIAESLKQLERSKDQTKKIEAWQARRIEVDVDVPKSGTANDYAEFTPEREAILFAEYWTKNKFGLIAKQIHHFSLKGISEKAEAGKVRKALDGKTLTKYEIIKIEDCAPAISEVTILFSILYESKNYSKTFTLRFIYQDEEGTPLVRGIEKGQWKFIESFFYQLEYL
jgi:hypothetical protein